MPLVLDRFQCDSDLFFLTLVLFDTVEQWKSKVPVIILSYIIFDYVSKCFFQKVLEISSIIIPPLINHMSTYYWILCLACKILVPSYLYITLHSGPMPFRYYSLFSLFGKKDKTNKASANKIKILVSLIWIPNHLTYFRWTLAIELFSGVYHPKDVRDEKVSSSLAHWEHGEIDRSRKFIRSMSNNGVFKSTIWEFWFYLPMPLIGLREKLRK